MNKSRIAALFATAVLLSASFPSYADLIMGVFPRRPVAVTHKLFKPLAEKLTKELGEPVKLVVSKDFKSFWKGVQGKEYDLVHFNQYHYIKSHKELGYEVIAVNEEFGSKQIAGALSVRKDSGIKTIADLKGKTILFGGGKKAMGSYIAPTSILKKAGLEAGKDYTVKFSKNPPSAVIAVYNKAAAAAGTGNVILKTKIVNKKIDASQMQILAESESFIQLPWAVKAGFDADKAKKIQSVMTTLKDSAEGKAIIKAARTTGFQAATDGDFAKVREITKFTLGEEY